MRTLRYLTLLFALLTIGTAHAAESNRVVSPRATVSLISATRSASGSILKLGLLFRLTPNWHIYWSDPGDAGEPPDITITSPTGAKSGAFAFPAPHWLVASGIGDYIESGTVLLPFALTLPAGTTTARTIKATAHWLVCDPKICVPEHGKFVLTLHGGSGASAQTALFAQASAQMPRSSPFKAIIAPGGILAVTGTVLTPDLVRSAHFYPDDPDAISNAAPQRLGFDRQGFTLALKPAHPAHMFKSLAGVLEITDRTGQTQALAVTATSGVAPASLQPTPWLIWIAAALLGGLILNLMPCVFPILAIKAIAVARLGEPAAARRDAFAYTAGTITAMLALAGILIALRATGAVIGWGFQFQSPIFIALMAWLMLAIGLNFAGLYEINGLQSLGSNLTTSGGPFGSFAAGRFGSFAVGLLAVVVATPCSAPFMAGAIAAALTAPLILALAIFAALGLGLALPFLLIAIIPGIAGRLPRPGAWMILLRQFLAFPMFGTAIWLLWIMALEAGAPGVLVVGAGAVLIALALWLLRFSAIIPRLVAAGALVATALLLARMQPATAASAPSNRPSYAIAFSPRKLAALRAAGTPVFIDMTAAWCITCQINERVALEPAAVQRDFAARHVTLMVGDWTRRDPIITRYLIAHDHDGVPLYVFYPPGHAPRIILPQILTPSIVMHTLDEHPPHAP